MLLLDYGKAYLCHRVRTTQRLMGTYTLIAPALHAQWPVQVPDLWLEVLLRNGHDQRRLADAGQRLGIDSRDWAVLKVAGGDKDVEVTPTMCWR